MWDRLRRSNLSRAVPVGVFWLTVHLGAGAIHAQSPPEYKVDASWPKELPNNWIFGRVAGVAIDAQDHVWVLSSPNWVLSDNAAATQTPPASECCRPAPAIIEFDKDGSVLKHWGGPGYVPDWPTQEHGFTVDKEGNVWIGGAWAGEYPPGPEIPADRRQVWDRQVLKFDSNGKLLLEIGHPTTVPVNNQDVAIFGAPAGIAIDDAAHEVYVADGFVNRRVVVYDSDTGVFKRGWGAYGIPLSEISNTSLPPYDPGAVPSKQFRGPVDNIRISTDGLVYVADRLADRVQVFTKEGKFVSEFPVAPATLGRGSAWTLAFSHDPQQRYLLVGDGGNSVVWILKRSDGSVAGRFGHRGYSAGQFDLIQDMATDSSGNLYVGEHHYSNRVQKFVLQK